MSIRDDLIYEYYVCKLKWLVEWLEKWLAKQTRFSDLAHIDQLPIEFTTVEYSKEQLLTVVASNVLQFSILKNQSSYVENLYVSDDITASLLRCAMFFKSW